jgi:hypothetical protein
VPPGIADATVPNPIFNLTPVATVDEGNNWINLRWGPLTMVNPVTSTSTTNVVLGNYALAAGSPAIDHIPSNVAHPTTDYFGNPRPDTTGAPTFDIGAVEFQTGGGGGGGNANVTIAPNPLTITLAHNILTGTGTVTFTNSAASTSPVTVTNVAVNTTGGSIFTFFFNVNTDNCTGVPLNPGQSCTVVVRFTNLFATRGVNRAGSITFTDNATGSPQSSGLVGFATP